MSHDQSALNRTFEEAVEAFRRLRQENPDCYDLKRPAIDPTTLEKVLRVDTLSNQGEACVSDLKIQLKADDPEGNKPFLVPWLEVDLLAGGIGWGVRDDRTRGWKGGFGVRHCQSRQLDARVRLCILNAVAALLRRDGFDWPAEEIELAVQRGNGIRYPRFQGLFRDWIIQQYQAAPEYKDNPWIHQEAMEPGQTYAFAYIPPRNWLDVKVARFTGYRDSYFGEEPRYPVTESPFLEFAVYRDRLATFPHMSDLTCHISRHDGQDYQGKVFPIPEAVYRQMLTHVSPKFDHATTDVPIPMPTWTKPLDSVADCLERLRTEAFAYDEDQKWEALSFLAEHRDQLTEAVSFSVPSQPNNGFAMTDEARWQTIIDNSQKSCGCGCIRKLVPINPRTGFDPNEDANAAVGPGQVAYLIPKDGERKEALVAVRVMESDGQHYLTFQMDPFSESFDILGTLQPQGYELGRLIEAMACAGDEKPKFGNGSRVFCQIPTIDPTTGQVWLTPDTSLRIEVEDK